MSKNGHKTPRWLTSFAVFILATQSQLTIAENIPAETPADNVIDTKATTQTDAKVELQETLKNFDGYQANFVQTVKDSEGVTIHESLGSLLFKQPGMFEWKVTEPESELLISNGETVWWFNPFVEQVTIYDAGQAMDKTPFALLVSSDENIWQQFDIQKSPTGFVIKPKDLEAAQVIKLEIKLNNSQLTEIAVTTRSRQVSTYKLSDQKLVQVEPTRFEFSIPIGVDIDDQRARPETIDGNVSY